LLRFDTRRTVLDMALAVFGIRPSMAVRPGGPTTIRVGDMLSAQAVAYLRRSPAVATRVRRIVRNAGKRGVDRIRKRCRQLDVILTRLFISSWAAELVEVTGTGLAIDLAFTNQAPYALYIHPKRTRKSRTFVNVDMPPILNEIAAEIAKDLSGIMRRITDAIATTIGQRLPGLPGRTPVAPGLGPGMPAAPARPPAPVPLPATPTQPSVAPGVPSVPTPNTDTGGGRSRTRGLGIRQILGLATLAGGAVAASDALAQTAERGQSVQVERAEPIPVQGNSESELARQIALAVASLTALAGLR
jgi:hypothetical protein